MSSTIPGSEGWTHLCGDPGPPLSWEEGGCGWSTTPQRELTCPAPADPDAILSCWRCLAYGAKVDGVWVTVEMATTPNFEKVWFVSPQSPRDEIDEKLANISATFQEPTP